jgi:hypothetical protein
MEPETMGMSLVMQHKTRSASYMLVKWTQTQWPSTALIKQDYSRSEDNQQVRAVYLRRTPIPLYLPAMTHCSYEGRDFGPLGRSITIHLAYGYLCSSSNVSQVPYMY